MGTNEMAERIWAYDDGAHIMAFDFPANVSGITEYHRSDLCASGQVRELERAVSETKAEATRMDRARGQFLGERNMLADALRDIQRGDMTNMMELTEAEAARARATWALKKIGTPVAALTPAPAPEAATPTAQEAVPVAWQVITPSIEFWGCFKHKSSAEDCVRQHIQAGYQGSYAEPLFAYPPQPSMPVAEAAQVIQMQGVEITASAMILHIAEVLRENGGAVLSAKPGNDFGTQVLEFAAALRALKGGDA